MNKRENGEKLRFVLDILCNLAVVVLTIWSVLSFFTVGGKGNMQGSSAHCFVYFTVDSNILAALACAAMLAVLVRRKVCSAPVPRWAILFKYVGTAAVSVTLFTVLLFLGPLMGYGAMFAGANLFMHLVSPLLAIVSLVLLETQPPLLRRSVWLGLLPTFVYGTLYLIMVIVIGAENGGWTDFYGFNMGGLWPASYIGMHIGTYVLGLALWALRRAAGKNNTRKQGTHG